MIVTPVYDQESETFVVEWPGMPEGPTPRFPNFPQARAFADRVERGELPSVAPSQPSPATPRPQPQPKQPESAFKPLQVSGLGTIARGKFLNRLGYDVSPRAHGDTVLVVTESVSRLFEPTPLDLRERRRSPLVQ